MHKSRASFFQALPVWLAGREREMNLQVGFICPFTAVKGRTYTLRLTGAALFRVFLNGEFIHYGPARGPHGYVRIDTCDLSSHVREGENLLSIEVAGYYCRSYYTIRIPSFLQAEILENDQVLHATGLGQSFKAVALTQRLQKVTRYSFQRTFVEIYALDNSDPRTHWTIRPVADAVIPAVVNPNVDYLPREVPTPKFNIVYPRTVIERGRLERIHHPPGFAYFRQRFVDGISEVIDGYPPHEVADKPFETLQDYAFIPEVRECRSASPDLNLEIPEGGYILLDMGLNNNGFIRSLITVREDSEVLVVFDEKLIDGRMDFKTWANLNVVKYSLKKHPAPYSLESFETYGFRYLLYAVVRGNIILHRCALREYSYPEFENTSFRCADEKISAVFQAAVETYRQNTLDVFMDCPTRERAGWLCDSFFTAQSAQYFSGNAVVEKVMLENYVWAKEFPYLPRGILPMCYPAEHPNGVFIPQWAMWYVVQLDGYFRRRPEAIKDAFRKLCSDLFAFLRRFRNSDGLLERLPSWNFVEWSDANKWVQDVNYPTNMLYARALELMGTWFNEPTLALEAKTLRERIIAQSFNGRYFTDNAVRGADGVLRPTNNASEICQYSAFFFQVADPSDPRFAPLVNLVLNVFGPDRKKNKVMPEIAYANAFIGNYLRMEVLLRWRRYNQVIRETIGYFHKMAELTGTLWENDGIYGSLNHGFASYAGVVIVKCLLGIQDINLASRTLRLDFDDTPIPASGRVGTSFGKIAVKREVKDGQVHIAYSAPDAFNVLLNKTSDAILVEKRASLLQE